MSIVVSKQKTVFIGDVNIHQTPSGSELANIAIGIANNAKKLGYNPKVAILSYSNFGNPSGSNTKTINECLQILEDKKVSFEFDGEMTAEVALDYDLIRENYPFCKLTGPANVLIMPDLYSANISFKLLQKMGNLSVIGPIMIGGNNPFQIVQMGSSVSDIVNSACISTYNSL